MNFSLAPYSPARIQIQRFEFITMPFIYCRVVPASDSDPKNKIIPIWTQFFACNPADPIDLNVAKEKAKWFFLNNPPKPAHQQVEDYMRMDLDHTLGLYRSVMSNHEDLCREFGQQIPIDQIEMNLVTHQHAGIICWPMWTKP